MQFCCNLKRETIYKQQLKNIIAIWLMVFFVGTSLFQVFHHHIHGAHHNHYSETSVQKWVKSCEVCNYIAHHQLVPILNVHQIEMVPPVISTTEFAGRYNIGFYKFTLKGFTNKGPPEINS